MKKMNLVLVAAAFGAAVNTASAAEIGVPSGTYMNDPAHTVILWSVSHFGLSNYIGRFDKASIQLDLDAKDASKSKISATIDPKAVNTPYPTGLKNFDFTKEVAGSKFLDAEKFPEINFVSTKIEVTGENTGTMSGDLTFHGVTKPVELKVTFNKALNPHPMLKKPAVGFSATGTVKRSDFGVSTLVGPVSDEVKLTIEAEFLPK